MPNKRVIGGNGKGGSEPLYKEPQDLIDAIDDYFAKPNFIQHHYKHDVYEVPEITVEAVARSVGYHEKYLYQLPTVRGEEWQSVVDHINSRMRSYYKMVGQHGNVTFANYMLACLGERPEKDEDEKTAPLKIEIIDAVKPDADTAN